MINPFTPMTPVFLSAYLQRKTIYLVIQNFTLENHLFKKEGKNYVLVTHYGDKGKALEHYDKIKEDTFSNFIDLGNEQQKTQFAEMLNSTSNYVMYSSLADLNAARQAVDKQLKYNIHKYLNDKNWYIKKNDTYVPDLELQFGVLHVILRYSGQRITVPLSELETYK